jgi:hypothetical protein
MQLKNNSSDLPEAMAVYYENNERQGQSET